MHMGQMIQSHALNFFHLSAPDFLLGMDADPAQRNVFGLIEKKPELAQGIRLRKFGQEIIENVAGKKNTLQRVDCARRSKMAPNEGTR